MDFPKRQTSSAVPANVRSRMGSVYLILPHAFCHLIQSLLSPSSSNNPHVHCFRSLLKHFSYVFACVSKFPTPSYLY